MEWVEPVGVCIDGGSGAAAVVQTQDVGLMIGASLPERRNRFPIHLPQESRRNSAVRLQIITQMV
jgi:hypothetical protein